MWTILTSASRVPWQRAYASASVSALSLFNLRNRKIVTPSLPQSERDDPPDDHPRGDQPAPALVLLQDADAERRAERDADLAGRGDVARGREGERRQDEDVGERRQRRHDQHRAPLR